MDDDWGSFAKSIVIESKPTGPQLPYDPFFFTPYLTVIKSQVNNLKAEYPIKEGIVLGRTDKDINLQFSNVSRAHCRFSGDSIQDIGSTSGTYLSMLKNIKRKIRPHDDYYIGPKQIILKIKSVSNRSVEFELNGKQQTVQFRGNNILIGCSNACDIIDPSFQQFQGQITSSGLIRHYDGWQDVDFNNGIFLRLSAKGQNSEPYSYQEGDVIKIGPVIFQIRY